jgi:HK97 family phage major capsid protein
LRYYTDLEEERQLLYGDGTGENLNGLNTQATSFNTGLLGSGWTRIDVVARAVQQLAMVSEFTPTFIAMNPSSWWSIRLTKTTQGEYILGDPQADVAPRMFTLRVIPTNSITGNGFLLGSGNPAAAEIRDRMETQVEISTQHSDYFTKNLIAIRAEKRLALLVKRPGSFITGSFSSSPA